MSGLAAATSTSYMLGDICVCASVFIATKQWCKDKVRLLSLQEGVSGYSAIGWNFQIKDHQITYLRWQSCDRVVTGQCRDSIVGWSQELRVEMY